MKPDERPWADHGNASDAEIFVVVGRALSCWEMVESAVAALFTMITVGDFHAPTTPMLRAYSAIVGSQNRVQMVQAALESWLLSWPDCPLGPNAVSLLKRCRNWAGRRNDIAHGLVDLNLDDARWYLFPSLYASRGRSLMANPVPGRPLLHKSDYRYNADIIDDFSREFLELFNEMNLVTSALGEWYRIKIGQQA
ncbi:hypothetical protein ACFQZO_23450 [Bradyrhizobium sp. GCM10027634]|uniref:hypothetical protein n=1 Tax=unclassified Bradyrhizobium TaxID=2631580 RepID=UPI00188A5C11|nr:MULTISPECIES: hypothetical protein [unclassified Bradyrhizobium]MDN5003796.1 hypothetical protein [Bradyrhizobium sp. WYCCWR 12677]